MLLLWWCSTNVRWRWAGAVVQEKQVVILQHDPYNYSSIHCALVFLMSEAILAMKLNWSAIGLNSLSCFWFRFQEYPAAVHPVFFEQFCMRCWMQFMGTVSGVA